MREQNGMIDDDFRQALKVRIVLSRNIEMERMMLLRPAPIVERRRTLPTPSNQPAKKITKRRKTTVYERPSLALHLQQLSKRGVGHFNY